MDEEYREAYNELVSEASDKIYNFMNKNKGLKNKVKLILSIHENVREECKSEIYNILLDEVWEAMDEKLKDEVGGLSNFAFSQALNRALMRLQKEDKSSQKLG